MRARWTATGRRRRSPTVLIHIGAHKTGTTSVQTMFDQHPEAFPGLYYPRSGRVGHAHHNLAWELIGHERFDVANGTIADLVAEVRRRRADQVLLSSEEFEYLYRDPTRLRRLRRTLAAAGYDTQVIAALRERCGYVESLYAELLKHDYRVPFDDCVEEILRTGGATFGQWDFRVDYAQLIGGFVEAFGARRVHVLEYRPEDSTRDFFDTCSRLTGLRLRAIEGWERHNQRVDFDYRTLPVQPGTLDSAQRSAIRERFGDVTVPALGRRGKA